MNHVLTGSMRQNILLSRQCARRGAQRLPSPILGGASTKQNI